MLAAIRYRVNGAGQYQYLFSGVHAGNPDEFLAKVEEWNSSHEDRYKVYDDPLVVLLALKLQEVRQKNGQLPPPEDGGLRARVFMMDDLNALSSRMSEVKTFLESQKEAGG